MKTWLLFWLLIAGASSRTTYNVHQLNKFSVHLFNTENQVGSKKNTVFSPLSILTCYSMILLGARGNTFSEMTRVLNTPHLNDKSISDIVVKLVHQAKVRLVWSLKFFVLVKLQVGRKERYHFDFFDRQWISSVGWTCPRGGLPTQDVKSLRQLEIDQVRGTTQCCQTSTPFWLVNGHEIVTVIVN